MRDGGRCGADDGQHFDNAVFETGQPCEPRPFTAGRADLAAGVLLLFIVSLLGESGRDVRGWLAARALPIRWAVMIGAAVVILLTGVWGSGFSEASFIYFNF